MQNNKSIFYIIAANNFLREAAEVILLSSLPAIVIALNTSNDKAKLTVALFLFGVFFNKLFLMTKISRRLTDKQKILFSVPCTAIGSLISLAPSIDWILVGRFLQGLGVGSLTTIQTSLLKKTFGKEFVKVSAKQTKYFRLFPFIAVYIGTLLQMYLGWYSNFIFLLLFSAGCYFIVWKFLPDDSSQKESEKDTLVVLKEFGSNPYYISNIIVYGLIYGGQAVFYTISPFLFMQDFSWSAHSYSWVIGVFVAGLFVGKWILQYTIQYLSRDHIAFWILFICLLTSLAFILIDFLNLFNAYMVLSLFFIYACALSAFGPIMREKVADEFSDLLTSSVAFFSLGFSLIASVLAHLSAQYLKTDILNLGIFYTIISLTALGIFLIMLFIRRKKADIHK